MVNHSGAEAPSESRPGEGRPLRSGRVFMALSTTDLIRRIAEIDEILAAGVTSVVIDGVQTNYSPKSLRAERTDLLAQLTGARTKQGCTPIRLDA